MMGCRAAFLVAALATLGLTQDTVSFPAPDGGVSRGDLYGRGPRGVVLLHGGRFDRKSWTRQANELANRGFRCLAVEFRPSDRERTMDVLAAVHYLRKTGAKTVAAVGASMGGDYAAEAVEAEPEALDRIVLLASGAYTPLLKMKGPKLFILAREDANADGPRLPGIRAQFEKAAEPKQLIIVEGSAHAQFLFGTDQGERVWRAIVGFLEGAPPDRIRH